MGDAERLKVERAAHVAPHLDRAGYDRARRECADELRELLPERHRELGYRGVGLRAQDVADLADRWSSPGRAAAGDERQR